MADWRAASTSLKLFSMIVSIFESTIMELRLLCHGLRPAFAAIASTSSGAGDTGIWGFPDSLRARFLRCEKNPSFCSPLEDIGPL